jgi:rhamnulokinase
MKSIFLAIDLGAESGRVIAVELADSQLGLTEVHRFVHAPIRLPSGLHWDITGLWREMLVGLERAGQWARDQQAEICSLGVDAWGVDWGLLGESGELIGLPHAYRDERYPEAYRRALEIVSADDFYRTTGIQLMPINTVFSLHAQQQWGPELFAGAARLAFIPDLFHYWLSGVAATEATIASTSQLIDVHSGTWSHELIRRLSLPEAIFAPLQPPGTVVGELRGEVAQTCGLPGSVKVVLPASHDTASAVAAVPARGSSWCYLSSGTWSLLGAELAEPCVTPAAQQAMFTNERGVESTIRFLKNIAGLWLVQQVRQDLARKGHEFSYQQLTTAAEAAAPFRTLFDVDRPEFQQPGSFLEKIDAVCRESRQPTPQSPGEYVRGCLESLALAYRRTLRRLENVLERRFETIHVVGGGGRNDLLNQITADALNRPVRVGPFEATAIGNGLVQAVALGKIAHLAELRDLVSRSMSTAPLEPRGADAWDRCEDRFEWATS